MIVYRVRLRTAKKFLNMAIIIFFEEVKDKEAFSGEADESVGHDQLGLSFNLSLTMDEIKQRAQEGILI